MEEVKNNLKGGSDQLINPHKEPLSSDIAGRGSDPTNTIPSNRLTGDSVDLRDLDSGKDIESHPITTSHYLGQGPTVTQTSNDTPAGSRKADTQKFRGQERYSESHARRESPDRVITRRIVNR